MSAQLSYKFFGPTGSPGGIYDLAPYAIDSFLNEESTGKMMFGVGVVRGSLPGANITLPNEDSAATDFEGITTNNRTTEYDLEGIIHVREGAAIGVMRYGRIYARVATDVEPAYGDQVYVLTSGDEVGCVTNAEDNAIPIKARFLTGVDATAGVAVVELFNQAQENSASNSGTTTP